METADPVAEPLYRPWISRVVAKVARISFALLMRPSLVPKALRQKGAVLT